MKKFSLDTRINAHLSYGHTIRKKEEFNIVIDREPTRMHRPLLRMKSYEESAISIQICDRNLVLGQVTYVMV